MNEISETRNGSNESPVGQKERSVEAEERSVEAEERSVNAEELPMEPKESPPMSQKLPVTSREIPISPEELRRRGIQRPDVLLVSGDAFCDHPSFGPAVVARLLESFGLTVALAAQPDPRDPEALAAFGRPRLFLGITAGNMDSMVNHYTAHRRKRRTDLYSPGGKAGLRPDRASIVYANLARRAFPDSIIILGGIEASMRRFVHFDYWQERIRRSLLLDAKADLLVYGMAERQLRAIVDRLGASAEPDRDQAALLRGIRGTAFALSEKQVQDLGLNLEEGNEVSPADLGPAQDPDHQSSTPDHRVATQNRPTARTGGQDMFRDPVEPSAWRIRELPSFESIQSNRVRLAQAARIASRAANPFLGELLVQRHDNRLVLTMPPALPLSSEELDFVHELPYSRQAHSSYDEPIPAMDRMKASIQINRGCFGGCTFCAIFAHQGRDIQSRSKASILREAGLVASMNKGIISDLGGPTANTWGMQGKDRSICRRCRRPSCLFPSICPNLDSDHEPLRRLLAQVRSLPGVRKVLIASGLRHDLAVRAPKYVEDLMLHHVGGHLHVAPEHNDPRVLRLAKKPSYEVFETFRRLFERIKARHDIQCFLNPYFVSGLPGSTDERMARLTRLLRSEGWKPRQVQSFIPTPGTPATAMFASGVNPDDPTDEVEMPRTLGDKIRQHRILTADLPDREEKPGPGSRTRRSRRSSGSVSRKRSPTKRSRNPGAGGQKGNGKRKRTSRHSRTGPKPKS